MNREHQIILPNHLRGRSIHKKVIPTVCNLENMLLTLRSVNGDCSKLKQWEKRSYRAYLTEKIQNSVLHCKEEELKELVRTHIQSVHPIKLGASCIDIYLVAYVAEMYGSGRENFFRYIFENEMTKKENSAQAIWQVGKGDGVYLNILNNDGSVNDWDYIISWTKG